MITNKAGKQEKKDPLIPDEDKNFCGSLVLDFGIWWHHMKTIYRLAVTFFFSDDFSIVVMLLHTLDQHSSTPMTHVIFSLKGNHVNCT